MLCPIVYKLACYSDQDPGKMKLAGLRAPLSSLRLTSKQVEPGGTRQDEARVLNPTIPLSKLRAASFYVLRSNKDGGRPKLKFRNYL